VACGYAGVASGIVVKIGSDSVIGRIATLADGLDAGETTLAKEMNHLIHLLLIMSAVSGLTFFAVSLRSRLRLAHSCPFSHWYHCR
jgi:magnesium-transporting ATPase (P-type)